MIREFGRAGVAVLAAVSCGLSPAAGSTVADESVLFETATVVARPLVEATASVTVLDRETIEALGVDTVAELIRFVPGLDLVSAGPRGGLAVAQVRGGDPNFTVVLLDGVPLNDATDLLRGGAVNLNGLPAALVERIEVIRGPLSSFFGSAALGGVINIITKRPPASGHAAALDVAAGDASMFQGAASWSAGSEHHGGLIGVGWGREKQRVAEDAFEQFDVIGNFRTDLSERSKLRVGGRIATWETDDYPDLSGGPVYGSGQTRHSEHDELALGAEWLIGTPERTHKVFLAVYDHELERDTPETPAAPAFVEETRYTRWRASWSAPLLVGRRVRLNVGAELDREDGRNESTFDFFGFPFPDSYGIGRTTGGAFMELLAERGPALVEVGARIDVPEGFDTEISPRVGTSFKLGDGGTRLRLSVGRGFKLPSFFVLASSPLLGANPDLDPERVLGFDAGVERRFHTGVTAGLTLFQSDYKKLIDFVPCDTVPGCALPPGSVTAVNRGDVRARGAEVTVGWTHQTQFQVQANVTRQDVEDRDSGEQLRNRPDWIAGAHATWHPCDRVRWTVDGQWVSESLDFFGATAGYQLYGSALAYDISHDLALRFRVDNLADKNYETFIGFPGPGRSLSFGLHWATR